MEVTKCEAYTKLELVYQFTASPIINYILVNKIQHLNMNLFFKEIVCLFISQTLYMNRNIVSNLFDPLCFSKPIPLFIKLLPYENNLND